MRENNRGRHLVNGLFRAAHFHPKLRSVASGLDLFLLKSVHSKIFSPPPSFPHAANRNFVRPGRLFLAPVALWSAASPPLISSVVFFPLPPPPLPTSSRSSLFPAPSSPSELVVACRSFPRALRPPDLLAGFLLPPPLPALEPFCGSFLFQTKKGSPPDRLYVVTFVVSCLVPRFCY
jgi:hypothetical protein